MKSFKIIDDRVHLFIIGNQAISIITNSFLFFFVFVFDPGGCCYFSLTKTHYSNQTNIHKTKQKIINTCISLCLNFRFCSKITKRKSYSTRSRISKVHQNHFFRRTHTYINANQQFEIVANSSINKHTHFFFKLTQFTHNAYCFGLCFCFIYLDQIQNAIASSCNSKTHKTHINHHFYCCLLKAKQSYPFNHINKTLGLNPNKCQNHHHQSTNPTPI